MAEELLNLIPFAALTGVPVTYVVDFDGQQRQVSGMRYRFGQNAVNGPVVQKLAVDKESAEQYLRRELDVARALGTCGGELLSKCVGYNFTEPSPWIVVNHHGRPLADVVRDPAAWPLPDAGRRKVVTDLLKGLELLRISGIVHGSIDLTTLYWDGGTLQIGDFGRAAICGEYPDQTPAHHGDDIESAARVIYQVHTGQPPPTDPNALRHQLQDVQDPQLRGLLLRRDLASGADIDYAFADEPERRPTARVLLERWDRRPHGVQWSHLVARDRAVRQDFAQLRERQRLFAEAYLPWVTRQHRIPRPRTAAPTRPTPAPQPVPVPARVPSALRPAPSSAAFYASVAPPPVPPQPIPRPAPPWPPLPYSTLLLRRRRNGYLLLLAVLLVVVLAALLAVLL
jgi:hypothetical protein